MAVEPRPVPGFRMVGEDGNAFAIIGRFQRYARRAGMPAAEVAEVREDAMSGDYNHLLATFAPYMEDEEEEACYDCGEPGRDCECDEAYGRL